MTITITIHCDNAAFEENGAGNEAARILHNLTVKLIGKGVGDLEGERVGLMDSNGNKVGVMEVEA